ncbi:Flagellar P-ring protein precursor [compost metagenome]
MRRWLTQSMALLLALVMPLALMSPAGAEVFKSDQPVRLKDIAFVQGAIDNQLTGLGLVVGLNGSGDTQQTGFTERVLRNLVINTGVYVAEERIRAKNVAVVTVTAKLPPFLKPGQKIDVTVASIGDAKSLNNGVLVQTPLMGPDGKTYAVAEGALSTGGFEVSANGSSVSKNQSLVARIPNGGIVQRDVPVTMIDANGFLHLNLNEPDFVTASRVAAAIQKSYLGTATAIDAATIRVYVTSQYRDNLVNLVARLEQVTVLPDLVAKVVIEERTGTVILGSNVRIGPVAITHGGLLLKVDTQTTVSQPNALSAGATTVVTNSTVSAEEQKAKSVVMDAGTTLGQLVRALNALGTTPRELISIVQNIKAAGALNAQLEII